MSFCRSRMFAAPSEYPLIAIFLGFSAIYCNVASNWPSRIMKCRTMSALNTTVHVESRRRRCSVRNISATPASPVWVATRMCSMYFDLGGASWGTYHNELLSRDGGINNGQILYRPLSLSPPSLTFQSCSTLSKQIRQCNWAVRESSAECAPPWSAQSTGEVLVEGGKKKCKTIIMPQSIR